MAAMINTMAVLTGLMFGLLSDRVGALKMCLFGLAMSAIGGMGSLFASGAPALLLSFVGGLIPASVLSSSIVYARSPKQVGTLQGLFMQFSNLGPFAGPPLIAMLVATTGLWQHALIVTGTAAVIGLLLGLTMRRYERPLMPLRRQEGLAKRF
jgi:MFS family permease